MKFQFEYPMKKGECGDCPFFRDHDDWYECVLDGGQTTPSGCMPGECPLEEIKMNEEPKKVVSAEDIAGMILKEIIKNEDVSFSLIGKQRSVLTWHPYPKEKPTDEDVPSEKQFLCYTDHGKYIVYHRRPTWSYDGVIAWAELPKPFMEAK